MPSCSRLWVGRRARSSPRKRSVPAVGANRPAIRFTVVLLPEPFGPMSPMISPSATARSRLSTARTPPKWRERPFSSSTRAPEQAVRPKVHGENDESAEEQVSPIAEKAQPLDEKGLHENHRRKGAEHASQAADDRIGDRESSHEHVEIGVLDMG